MRVGKGKKVERVTAQGRPVLLKVRLKTGSTFLKREKDGDRAGVCRSPGALHCEYPFLQCSVLYLTSRAGSVFSVSAEVEATGKGEKVFPVLFPSKREGGTGEGDLRGDGASFPA